MKKFLLLMLLAFTTAATVYAAPEDLKITSPKSGDEYRVGRTVTLSWDTLDTKNNRTFESTFEFLYAEAETGPWSLLAVGKNKKDFKDVNSKNANAAAGSITTVLPRKNTLYIKMQLKGSTTVNNVVGPISVVLPAPATADSLITGDITNTITLTNTKIYQLKKFVFVQSGAVLRIEPGTIILGDAEAASALCINRGGKIYAQGTSELPIVFTSGYTAGSRDRGDWGGVLVMGSAKTNLGEAAIEGGIADDASTKKNGWYGALNGVNNDEDSSGVISYVRIEFAGIAESPDNELNGLTMGAVGSKTVINHVQVSYGGDDAYEWFGGNVNAKYMIAYNTIDDDFDTDNGFSGKVQFGLVKRFVNIADQSNSEAFESDNDSKASENEPFTRPIFANFTVIGPLSDTTMAPGTGDGKYNSKFLTAVQIRRNSRMSLVNSVVTGWPAGVEMTNQNTVRAAASDSTMVMFNDFYGIKKDKFFYLGSGTNAEGNVDASWLSKSEYGNKFMNADGNTGSLAMLNNAFPANLPEFNPAPTSAATYKTTAQWTGTRLEDTYFDKVSYRGAFGEERWDMGWAEYDPVNKEYHAVSAVENSSAVEMYVNVAPMPVNESAVVTYTMLNEGNVSIKLFDAVGSIKADFITNEFKTAGAYQFLLNTNGLATGVYYLQIATPNSSTITKIPIVK